MILVHFQEHLPDYLGESGGICRMGPEVIMDHSEAHDTLLLAAQGYQLHVAGVHGVDEVGGNAVPVLALVRPIPGHLDVPPGTTKQQDPHSPARLAGPVVLVDDEPGGGFPLDATVLLQDFPGAGLEPVHSLPCLYHYVPDCGPYMLVEPRRCPGPGFPGDVLGPLLPEVVLEDEVPAGILGAAVGQGHNAALDHLPTDPVVDPQGFHVVVRRSLDPLHGPVSHVLIDVPRSWARDDVGGYPALLVPEHGRKILQPVAGPVHTHGDVGLE